MLLNLLKNLKPTQAWNQFVDQPVELFISDFFVHGVTDIFKMCKMYAKDVLDEMNTPYGFKTHEHLTQLLADHINNYILVKGGIDNLTIYTEEELEQMFEEDTKALLDLIRKMETKSSIFKKRERT